MRMGVAHFSIKKGAIRVVTCMHQIPDDLHSKEAGDWAVPACTGITWNFPDLYNFLCYRISSFHPCRSMHCPCLADSENICLRLNSKSKNITCKQAHIKASRRQTGPDLLFRIASQTLLFLALFNNRNEYSHARIHLCAFR